VLSKPGSVYLDIHSVSYCQWDRGGISADYQPLAGDADRVSLRGPVVSDWVLRRGVFDLYGVVAGDYRIPGGGKQQLPGGIERLEVAGVRPMVIRLASPARYCMPANAANAFASSEFWPLGSTGWMHT
jgi:hypothetical protein